MKVLALTRSSSWEEMRPAVKLCWRRWTPLGFLTGSQRTLAGHLDTLRLQLLLALPRDIFSTEPLVSFFHLVHVAIQCDTGYLCLHINNSTKHLCVRFWKRQRFLQQLKGEEALTSRSGKSNWNWRVENLTIAAIILLSKWKIIEEYGFWGSLDEEINQNMVSNFTILFWKTYVVGIYNCLTLRQEGKIWHNLDASAFKHLSKKPCHGNIWKVIP